LGTPGLMAKFRTGGSNFADKTQIENAIRTVHAILANCGVEIGPMRVKRLVRQFHTNATRSGWHGWTLFDFLANEIHLTADQGRKLLADPDFQRVIAYADPTGEDAVSNVMRGAARAKH
jgi:hypothetical protein